MNVLSVERQAAIIDALIAGHGVRAIMKSHDVANRTITQLAYRVGRANTPLFRKLLECAAAHGETVVAKADTPRRGINCQLLIAQPSRAIIGWRFLPDTIPDGTRLSWTRWKRNDAHALWLSLHLAHVNLCQPIAGGKRTPAHRLRFTDHRWTTVELLAGFPPNSFPVGPRYESHVCTSCQASTHFTLVRESPLGGMGPTFCSHACIQQYEQLARTLTQQEDERWQLAKDAMGRVQLWLHKRHDRPAASA